MSEAIILAAGVGSRLAAVHGGAPKCLVPVAGRSILEWQLTALADVGVGRVVIVTGYEAERVKQAALSRSLPIDFAFVRNPDFLTTNVLSSWMLGSRELTGDHIYLHGDTVFEPLLLERLISAPDDSSVVLTVDQHECADEEMKVIATGECVHRISKALSPAEVVGEFTGVLRAPGQSLPLLRQASEVLLAEPEGAKAFFEAALQHLIDRALLDVTWIDVTGLKWQEVDFPADLARAESLLAPTA